VRYSGLFSSAHRYRLEVARNLLAPPRVPTAEAPISLRRRHDRLATAIAHSCRCPRRPRPLSSLQGRAPRPHRADPAPEPDPRETTVSVHTVPTFSVQSRSRPYRRRTELRPPRPTRSLRIAIWPRNLASEARHMRDAFIIVAHRADCRRPTSRI
jgi:hypothetical protein